MEAESPPTKIVSSAVITKKVVTFSVWCNRDFDLIIKNTPAATNVAECISADAGAGASMESGSQKWKKNWADLQEAAISNVTLVKEIWFLEILFRFNEITVSFGKLKVP